jgi:tRNA(Ile)-lysidine synthetase-like protein
MLIRLAADLILVAHLDHRLRGGESAEDAEFVRELVRKYRLQSIIGAADVRAEAENLGLGIEETAREVRYRFLLDAARQRECERIAVGHTMSDQAETFLMRLARGAGLRGLAAMRPVRSGVGEQGIRNFKIEISNSRCFLTDKPKPPTPDLWPLLIRPLLAITREEVEEYCRERGLEFRTDPTNLTADYTRNRVRREVLPALRAINPRVIESIARAAEAVAADQDALARVTCSLLDQARESAHAYRIVCFVDQPEGLRRRMIIEAARKAGNEVAASHVIAIEELIIKGRSGNRMPLPGGAEVWREFELVVFGVRREPDSLAYELEIDEDGGCVRSGGIEITLSRDVPGEKFEEVLAEARRERERTGRDWMMAALDEATLPERLTVRPRRRGERAEVVGQSKTKKLKNLMIDHKIPSSRRFTWPVVATPDGLYVWSPGLPPSSNFAARGRADGLAILRASFV